jgi:hypothetical protein
LIGLHTCRQCDRPHWHARCQRALDRRGSASTGLIAIEHQDDTLEVGAQEVGLIARQCRPHQADDRISRLVDRDRIEESFDDDDLPLVSCDRSVEVEEDERFPEAGRKSILRLVPVDGSARVGDELTGDVVNRNDDPTAQQTLPGVEPESKRPDRRWRHAARREVGMRRIDVLQRKPQRWIRGHCIDTHGTWYDEMFGSSTGPLVHAQSGVSNRAALHQGRKVEDISTWSAAASLHTRQRAARPHVARDVDGEAIATPRGRVRREWTPPAQFCRADAAQMHAVMPEHVFDRDVCLQLFEVDPGGRHHDLPT